MDPNNPVVRLCAQGMQAEGEGRAGEARWLYERAWAESKDDFEACAAAHYLARQQPSADETFRWNEVALERADAASVAGDERVRGFYPSLYLNMGKCHEDLGDPDRARRRYETAAKKAENLPDDGYGNLVRRGIASGLERTGHAEKGLPQLPSRLRLCVASATARSEQLRSSGLRHPHYRPGLVAGGGYREGLQHHGRET